MITLLGDDIEAHLIGRKGSRSLQTAVVLLNYSWEITFTTLYNISLCLGFDVAFQLI